MCQGASLLGANCTNSTSASVRHITHCIVTLIRESIYYFETRGLFAPSEEDAESLLPTRRSSRVAQRRHHVSEPLPGFPTHLPATAYITSQAIMLPPLSMPSATGPHTCEALHHCHVQQASSTSSGHRMYGSSVRAMMQIMHTEWRAVPIYDMLAPVSSVLIILS